MYKRLSHYSLSYNSNECLSRVLEKEFKKGQRIDGDNIYGEIMINKVKDFYSKKKSLGYSSLVSIKNNKYASGLKEKLQMLNLTTKKL